MVTPIGTPNNTFFVFVFPLLLHLLSDQWDGVTTPRGESNGKDKRGLSHAPRQPQRKVNKIMKQELQEVADLVTANTIFTTKEVLTSDETARYLGVSKSCLYKWTMARQIPHYKSPTGKLCYFNRKEVEAWAQECRVATAEEISQQAQAYCIKKGGRR